MQTNELIPIFFWEIVFVICGFWCLSCDMLLTYVCILCPCIIHHSIRTAFNGECCLFCKIKSIHLIFASSQPFPPYLPPFLHSFSFSFFSDVLDSYQHFSEASCLYEPCNRVKKRKPLVVKMDIYNDRPYTRTSSSVYQPSHGSSYVKVNVLLRNK